VTRTILDMGRNRIVIAVLGLVVVLGVAVASAFTSLLMFLDTCDGDGGYPYSAPASVAGRFCDSPVATPYFLAEFAVPILVAAVLSVVAGVQQRISRVAIGLGAALVTLIVMCAFVASLNDSCTADQKRDDPYNCQTLARLRGPAT
jgi:hypothetical protein